MMTADVNVVLLDFPTKGREMVVENEDGSFTILINSKLAYSGQLAAYNHAMTHIEQGDFQKHEIQSIEAAAHTPSIPSDAERIPAGRYLSRLKSLQAYRRRIQKKLREVEEDMELLESTGLLDSFGRAESQWFYGNDL